VPEKGILTLIKAVSGLKDKRWKLLLLGRGELQTKIIEEMAQAGLKERLILVESVPHTQVPHYLNLMNTLVLPSETTYEFKTMSATGWKEQFGHVLIEAMACKVPVIGSNSGEIPHVIGDAGLIFPEKDEIALQNCLTQMIEKADLAQDLGEKGYQRVMDKYTNKALAKELLNFYKQII
jgi:glycosyltransferase involved in cell wall biosynthesis